MKFKFGKVDMVLVVLLLLNAGVCFMTGMYKYQLSKRTIVSDNHYVGQKLCENKELGEYKALLYIEGQDKIYVMCGDQDKLHVFSGPPVNEE